MRVLEPSEAELERRLVRSVKALGGVVRKVSWVNRRGAPDRLLLFPSIGRAVFVELKAAGGKLHPLQRAEAEILASSGLEVRSPVVGLVGLEALLKEIRGWHG